MLRVRGRDESQALRPLKVMLLGHFHIRVDGRRERAIKCRYDDISHSLLSTLLVSGARLVKGVPPPRCLCWLALPEPVAVVLQRKQKPCQPLSHSHTRS